MDHDIVNAACDRALLRPFQWGEDDCCTFVCDAIANATGSDPMASLRGTYASENDALEATAGLGLVDTVIHLAAKVGFRRVEFPFTEADFGLITSPKGPMMALFHEGHFIGRGEFGVHRVPNRCGFMAWAIE